MIPMSIFTIGFCLVLERVKLSLKLKIIDSRTVRALTLPTDSQMEAHVWAQTCAGAGSSSWEDCTARLATVGGGNVFICLVSLLSHAKLA